MHRFYRNRHQISFGRNHFWSQSHWTSFHFKRSLSMRQAVGLWEHHRDILKQGTLLTASSIKWPHRGRPWSSVCDHTAWNMVLLFERKREPQGLLHTPGCSWGISGGFHLSHSVEEPDEFCRALRRLHQCHIYLQSRRRSLCVSLKVCIHIVNTAQT